MNLEMASALIQERQRELARKAGQWQALHDAREGLSPDPARRAQGWRLPRYRISWSRTSLSRVGTAGRRERSWVIVISASKGL
jgi:hypothetical protein